MSQLQGNLRRRSNRLSGADDVADDGIAVSGSSTSPSTTPSSPSSDQLGVEDVPGNAKNFSPESDSENEGLEVDVSSESDHEDHVDNDKTLHSKASSMTFPPEIADDDTIATSLNPFDDTSSLNPFVDGDNGDDDAASSHNPFNDDATFDHSIDPFDSASREVSIPDFSSLDGEESAVTSVTGDNMAPPAKSTSRLPMPDLTSPEPVLRVTGSEVRRAASMLRRKEGEEEREDDKNLRRRRRRKSWDSHEGRDSGVVGDDDADVRSLKAPSNDNELSRSSSPGNRTNE